MPAHGIGNKTDAAVEDTTTDKSIMAMIKGISDKQAREIHTVKRQTVVTPLVTVTATAADFSLGTATFEAGAIPSGAVIRAAYLWVTIREIEDTSASENDVDAADTPAVQVRTDAPGAWSDAILIVDAQWLTPASGTTAGGLILGTIDVKSVVAADDGYDIQFDQLEATGANLLLRDVQAGIVVEYSLT